MNIADLGIIIGGILTPIATATYFIVKEVKKIQVKNRIKLNGTWSNEGDITSNERDYITIELKVDMEDGQITGLMHCDSLISTSTQSILGKMGFNSAVLYVSRVSHQQYIETLKAKVILNGRNLKWTVLRDDHHMKPHKSLLFKLDNNFKWSF